MRYWTICYPTPHPTQDFDVTVWETLSDKEILDQYWVYWFTNMIEARRPDFEITSERCIEDWCVVHWAQRNHWREIMEHYQ